MFPCLQDKEPLGIIPLENLSVRKVDDPKKPVSVHCLALCQHRLSQIIGGKRRCTQITPALPKLLLFYLLLRGKVPLQFHVPPSKHGYVFNLRFWCE